MITSLSTTTNFDFIFKFIIIGDSGTGKSCVLHQFVEGKFRSAAVSRHTIGVEYGCKTLALPEGKLVKLQIWDTAGQERFRSVSHSYYRSAVGVLVVYDVTSRSSFEHLPSWIEDARTLAGPDVTIIVCGNKRDRERDDEGDSNHSGKGGGNNHTGERKRTSVSLLEGSRFAMDNDCMFLETSALDGTNVNEAFMKCVRTILAKIESGAMDATLPKLHGGHAEDLTSAYLRSKGKKTGGELEASGSQGGGGCGACFS